MGILSTLAKAGIEGLFGLGGDWLKTKMYLDRLGKQQNIQYILGGLEGMDPASPEAEAARLKLKDLGIDLPTVDREMAIPSPFTGPFLKGLAQEAEKKPMIPPALTPDMSTLAGAAEIPQRKALAVMPKITSDQLMAKMAQKAGGYQPIPTLDALGQAKGIVGRQQIAIDRLEHQKEIKGATLKLLEERVKSIVAKNDAQVAQMTQNLELAKERIALGKASVEEKERHNKDMKEFNEKRLKQTKILEGLKHLDRMIADPGKVSPEHILGYIKTFNEMMGYEAISPKMDEMKGFWKGFKSYFANPGVIGYEPGEGLKKELEPIKEPKEAPSGSRYKETGETRIIGGKKMKIVVDSVTGERGYLE